MVQDGVQWLAVVKFLGLTDFFLSAIQITDSK